MDQIDTAIAITANADKNMSQISFSPTGSDMLLVETGSSARPFGGYLFQFSQGVTPDPPPIIIHLTNSDFKMAIRTTEWKFPDAWATDWISKNILENQVNYSHN